MVSLEAIRESNSRIATGLLPGLVAVFVGATSGIGETTLKHFARYTSQPRTYFLGRREEEGKRIEAELQKINARGEYHYMKYDTSLIRNVDEACRHIQSQESAINLLFLSSGSTISGRDTDEGLHYPLSLVYYSRTRFTVNLLPQLKQAPSLRRVVTVAAAGSEGPVTLDDLQARKADLRSSRGHITSMITLLLHEIAKQAPEVSFVHDYPGTVLTDLTRELIGNAPSIPIDETGERQVYLATSARLRPREGGADGVAFGHGAEIAIGVDGETGSGVYSVDYEAEGTTNRVQELVKGFVEDRTAQSIWNDTQKEFVRITGSASI